MDYGTAFVVMVAITGVVVAGTVGLVIRQKVYEKHQKVHARTVLAHMYGVSFFEDIAAVPNGACESCHRNRATVTVSVAGRPVFLVCQGCAPVEGIAASTVRALPGESVWVEPSHSIDSVAVTS